MSRNAKITLTAEVRGFKTAVADARKTLEGLGDVQIDSDSLKKLKEAIGSDLVKKADDVSKKFNEINEELENMAKGGEEAFDSTKAVEYTKALKGLKETLDDIKQTQADIKKGGFESFIEGIKGGTTAGDKKGGGLKGMMGGGLMKIAGPLMAALGVGAVYSKAKSMAEQNIKIRQLSTDTGGLRSNSKLGFDNDERRGRALDMAKSMGGGSSEDITRYTDMGEQVERAYGVEASQSSGFVGASRKAGGANAEKAMSNAIGSAVAAGLEGSKIGEYLGAMTGYMESLSTGVNIDQGSLTGFAGALSSMPFFKNDPNRSFSTIKSLDNTFKGGDAFQTGMANRAIMGAGGPMDAASLANRRAAGLFGNELDDTTMKQLEKAGVNTKGLKTSGSDIVQNMFQDVMKSTQGMGGDERLNAFRERTGMEFGDSATLFGQLSSGKGPTKDMVKKFKESQMSPEERLAKTMGSVDGNMLKLTTSLNNLYEGIVGKLIPPLTKLANGILGMFGDNTQSSIGNMVDGAEGVAGAAAGLYGASKLSKLGKGAGGLAKKVAPKTAAKVASKTAGKIASRTIPVVKNLIAIGYTASDAYDIYKKKMAGEDTTGLDWAKLGLSAGSIFDPTPATGLARIGADFIPDGAGDVPESMGAPEGGVPASLSPNADMGAPATPSADMKAPDFGVPDFTGAKTSSSKGGATPSIGNEAATIQNTVATQQLTQAMMAKSGGGRKGSPSYAKPMTGTVGK